MLRPRPGMSEKRRLQFCVWHDEERSMELRANTDEDMKRWVRGLILAIDILNKRHGGKSKAIHIEKMRRQSIVARRRSQIVSRQSIHRTLSLPMFGDLNLSKSGTETKRQIVNSNTGPSGKRTIRVA